MSTPTTADAKRRGQAFAGGITGVAVIVVLVVVFLVLKAGDDGKPDTGVAQAAPTQSAPPPAAEQPDPTQPDPAQPDPAQPQVAIPPALATPPVVKAGAGAVTKLKVTTLIPGDGPAVQKGQTITVNYALVDYKTGQPLDSSYEKGQPLTTPIGVGKLIPGFDQGVTGQKVGSRIQLDVPAALAYGPSQGDLRFVVDILAAQ